MSHYLSVLPLYETIGYIFRMCCESCLYLYFYQMFFFHYKSVNFSVTMVFPIVSFLIQTNVWWFQYSRFTDNLYLFVLGVQFCFVCFLFLISSLAHKYRKKSSLDVWSKHVKTKMRTRWVHSGNLVGRWCRSLCSYFTFVSLGIFLMSGMIDCC